MPHIFISYAKKDTRLLAEVLFQTLNSMNGLTAWMDMSLEADESWAYQIQQEIDHADYIVVLLSPDVNRPISSTQRRSFVLNEIDYAQQDNKPILPVMVQRTKMPVQIAGLEYIDLTSTPYDPALVVGRICQRFNLVMPGQRTAPSMMKKQLTAQEYFSRGNERYDNQDYDGAVADLTEAIRLEPAYAAAYTNRANIRMEKRDDYSGAIADYTEAIRLNPKSVAAHVGRGVAFSFKRDYDSAIADFSEAIRLNPTDADAYYGRARVRQTMGDIDGAHADFAESRRFG